MTATRINPEGELQVFHSETGGYVPASVLLQVENGLLAALVPDQAALLSDIRNASAYLQFIEEALVAVRTELSAAGATATEIKVNLSALAQIDAALVTVIQAIDALEPLAVAANALLSEIKTEIVQNFQKLPATLGAKSKTDSLSVALATDSSIFASLTGLQAALSDGGGNTAYTALTALSNKLPVSLGQKLKADSLSVALATDSAVFTSLASLIAALSDGGANSVYTALAALSAKIPTSVGAKINAASLSVALATDSPVFSALTSLLGALSDGGSNSALSYLSTVSGAQFWKTPAKINTASPIINAATAATSSAAYTLNSQTEALSLQNFFSATGLSAQFAVELRVTAGASSLSDKTYYYRGDVASPFLASAGAYPGESPIIIPTYGYAQVVVNLSAISGGNVTTYAKEIK